MRNINAESLIAWATFNSDHAALRVLSDSLALTVDTIDPALVNQVDKAISPFDGKLNFSLRDALKWSDSLTGHDISEMQKLSKKAIEHLRLAISVKKLIDSRLRPISKEQDAAPAVPDASVQINPVEVVPPTQNESTETNEHSLAQ